MDSHRRSIKMFRSEIGKGGHGRALDLTTFEIRNPRLVAKNAHRQDKNRRIIDQAAPFPMRSSRGSSLNGRNSVQLGGIRILVGEMGAISEISGARGIKFCVFTHPHLEQ